MSAIVVTAAQIAQCFSDSARAEIYNVILAEAATKGQGLYQTTTGTFGLWDMAAVAKDEPRGFALEAGAIGEAVSMLKYGPMYGLTLAGNHDSLVYASPTIPGGVDDAGVVSVGRVVALADASKTKVLFVDCREQPVKLGWLALDGIGFTTGGTASDKVTTSEVIDDIFAFHSSWSEASGDSWFAARRDCLKITGLESKDSQAYRAEIDFAHASGALPLGGSAGHFAAHLNTGNTGFPIANVMAGLNASLIIAAEVRTLTGVFTCLRLQSQIGADNVLPALQASFMHANEAGAVKLPIFLNIENLVSGDANAVTAESKTYSNPDIWLRVKTSLGLRYLALHVQSG